MNIGIDIDGILTDFHTWILDYGSKYFYEKDIPVSFKLDSYKINDLFNLEDECYKDFWRDMFFVYLNTAYVRTFASEVINKLKLEGNNIYIITSRNASDSSLVSREELEISTKSWLEKNGIFYDSIHYAKESKVPIIESLNIDVMIDDQMDNIEPISKLIPVICMHTAYNADANIDNLYRCYSWYDIYKTIKEINL